MAFRRTKILAPLCILAVIMLLLATVAVLLLNLSPKQLGIADEEILNGKSIADMDLQDVKLIEALPIAKSLCSDNSKLIDYPPQKQDVIAVDSVFTDSSLTTLIQPLYSSLIYRTARFNSRNHLVLTDKQLAALINKVIQQTPTDPVLSTIGDLLEFLQSSVLKDVLYYLEYYEVTFEQLKLVDCANTARMQIALSMNISQYVDGVSLPLFGKMNGKIYALLDYSADVSIGGKLRLKDATLSVNGKNAELSERLLNGLFIALAGDSEPMTVATVTDGIALFIRTVLEHVGKLEGGILGSSGINTANSTLTFTVSN